MIISTDAFKAYDIRGRVPGELNEEFARRLGRAFAELYAPRRVAVGRDMRLSGAALAAALGEGLRQGGVDVVDLGLCGTEQVYFATFHHELDGGVMVTASHNPADYNGMKLVRAGSRPISGDTGLAELAKCVAGNDYPARPLTGGVETLDTLPAYVEHLLGYVDRAALKPMKIVVNAGNGMAGQVIDALAEQLPFEFIRLQFEPDGTFPNGVPNPLLPENRAVTAEAVRAHGADFGIAWDGDFDRCFLFDEDGAFIEGYYIVGLLAEVFLAKVPGARVVHDPRLTWNTLEIVEAHGGTPVLCKSGHAFIKERMREVDAVYGGEMSAHHYFRDFAYCDSGMIPWLLVAELLATSGLPLSELVGARIDRYPVSGEINRRVANPAEVLAEAEDLYAPAATAIDHIDGLSIEYPDWRFNLRASNTEPLIRLNVESRGDRVLMAEKTAELLALLDVHVVD